MSKFLIEVPHEAKKEACMEAVRIFQETGNHFLTNADWGCMDGEHKAWLLLEIDSKSQANNILPPMFRNSAKIVELVKFETEDLEKNVEMH
jgi:hypothetical protein